MEGGVYGWSGSVYPDAGIAVEGGVLGADGGKEGLQERPGGVEGGDGGHWAGGRRRRWGRRRGRGRWRWYQVSDTKPMLFTGRYRYEVLVLVPVSSEQSC